MGEKWQETSGARTPRERYTPSQPLCWLTRVTGFSALLATSCRPHSFTAPTRWGLTCRRSRPAAGKRLPPLTLGSLTHPSDTLDSSHLTAAHSRFTHSHSAAAHQSGHAFSNLTSHNPSAANRVGSSPVHAGAVGRVLLRRAPVRIRCDCPAHSSVLAHIGHTPSGSRFSLIWTASPG